MVFTALSFVACESAEDKTNKPLFGTWKSTHAEVPILGKVPMPATIDLTFGKASKGTVSLSNKTSDMIYSLKGDTLTTIEFEENGEVRDTSILVILNLQENTMTLKDAGDKKNHILHFSKQVERE